MCLTDGDDTHSMGILDMRQRIQAGLHERGLEVVIPQPEALAATAFARLTGYAFNEAQEVLHNLLIGNSTPAFRLASLQQANVGAVVRCYSGEGERYDTLNADYSSNG